MTPALTPRALLDLFFHQVCDRQRLEVLDEILAPGFVFLIPPDRLDSVEAVKAGLRRLFTAFPDLRFTLGGSVLIEEEVMVPWQADGTHLGPYDSLPPTGRRFRYQGVAVLTQDREGRLTRAWMVSNLKEMMDRLR